MRDDNSHNNNETNNNSSSYVPVPMFVVFCAGHTLCGRSELQRRVLCKQTKITRVKVSVLFIFYCRVCVLSVLSSGTFHRTAIVSTTSQDSSTYGSQLAPTAIMGLTARLGRAYFLRCTDVTLFIYSFVRVGWVWPVQLHAFHCSTSTECIIF